MTMTADTPATHPPRSAGLSARIQAQLRARGAEPAATRIKVNLYTAAETRAVAEAAARLAARGWPSRIDCLMIGDSYLTTHLNRPSTRLDGTAEQAAFFEVMLGLVGEVARAAAEAFAGADRPWVLGDLPDGAAATPNRALDSIARMVESGADAVKLEAASPEVFAIIERASRAGLPTAAHIGYTPQTADNRKYGSTEAEALALIAQARQARDAGAVAVVIERVEQPVNAQLCRPHPRALPVYAIFSGQVPFGGQSLNVFDSVIRPNFQARAFPPTADLGRGDYPACYTHDAIVAHISALLELVYTGAYPRPLASALPAAAADRLAATAVWD